MGYVVSRMKKWFEGLKARYEKLMEKPAMQNPYVQAVILSFISTLLMELLSKRSLIRLIAWLFTHPLAFLTNVLICLICYLPCLCIRHKNAAFGFIFTFLLAIGVIDCMVISSRVTPFTANDLRILNTVFTVFNKYLSPVQMVLCGLLLAASLILLFLFMKKAKVIEGPFSHVKHIAAAVLIGLAAFGGIRISMDQGFVETKFANLRGAYQDNGLAYCFSSSIFNVGVSKTEDYSSEKVEEVVSAIDTAEPEAAASVVPEEEEDDRQPNVIFVQLESFFNVNRLKGVEFTENPIPNLTSLYENCHTGLLSVPVISAGTANTEFEVLTGMNTDDFGPGEYPYQSILRETTAESMAYNLSELGYSTHAMHNNTGTFYGRDVVYSNLGFEHFTSVEYMQNVERNALDWAKDKVLTRYINEALDSTDNEDFVFAVSVQGHGEYPDEDVLEDPSLLKSVDMNLEIGEFNFAYYLEQIREMDAFVGELVESLSQRDEKTVLVLYGDHLPGFEFEEEDLSTGTLYDTEYVIWTNFDIGERQVVDLQAYQLSAYVQTLLGDSNGLLAKLHQANLPGETEEYLDALKTLEYDMLYGEKSCWNGVNPYTAAAISYGYDPITITDVQLIADPDALGSYYMNIHGTNFTSYSVVYLEDGTLLDTIYVDESSLFVPKTELLPGSKICVSQSSKNLETLSHTDFYDLGIEAPAEEESTAITRIIQNASRITAR